MDMERFWRKVDKSGDCWIWTGAISKGGYGNVCYIDQGKKRWNTPHRLLWIELHGPIQTGLEVDHVCHDPASCQGGAGCMHRRCVNPDHLQLTTPKQNSSPERNANSRRKRERTHCPHGHPYDETNTTWSGGSRLCRTCNNLKVQRYRERRKGASQ